MIELVKLEGGGVALYRAGGAAVLVLSPEEVHALERALSEAATWLDA